MAFAEREERERANKVLQVTRDPQHMKEEGIFVEKRSLALLAHCVEMY